MFPYTHAQSISNVRIKLCTECFHTSYLEVVNPPSDELVEFLNFITVADTPATACEFFHSSLKLCY